ncbi:MAG: serine/threonine-protein kinase [Polyangiaceae bacterium]
MQEGDLVTPRFRLVSLAGRGGMGEVWRADDLERGGAVALKFLLGPGVGAERFAREAELLASVEHPALVRYVAHGAGDGRPWLAMRWIAGPSLEARLATSPLDADEALAVSRRIASALAALHARGIVHRDVKPSNVALDGGDPSAATLLDLGIARPLFATEALTGTNLALGTIGYMAPEQARGERDVDARADVFALGALLYECLAGEPAFGGDNAIAVLSAPPRSTPAARRGSP